MAEALATLSDVVGAFEESYERGGFSAAQNSEAEFAPVLAAAVDPLLAACERSAEALSPDAPSRCLQHIYDQPSSVDPMHEAPEPMKSSACASKAEVCCPGFLCMQILSQACAGSRTLSEEKEISFLHVR